VNYKVLSAILSVVMVMLLLPQAVMAQGSVNSLNSVKVQSAGDNAVVVDVYVNSSDAVAKPQISSRKYSKDKFIIDLINVQDQGGATKDTSGSAGLVNSSSLKIGNLPGGSSSRVLIDLDNPDINVKEVRYHVVSQSSLPTTTVASKPEEKASQVQPSKPEPVVKPEPKPSVKPEPKPQSQPKAELKPETKPEPENQSQSQPQAKAELSVVKSSPEKKSGPVVVHKTDKPAVTPEKTSAPPVKPESKDKSEAKLTIDKKTIVQAKPEEKPAELSSKPSEPSAPENIEQVPINLGDDPPAGRNIRSIDVKDDELDYGQMITTFGWALLIVIPLILVVIWVMSMVYKGGEPMGLKSLAAGGGNRFKIISSTSLGQGKSVHLVEIKGRQLVIGCTNNSINILTEFDEFDEFVEDNKSVDTHTAQSSRHDKYRRSRPPTGSFSDLYKDYKKRIDENDLEDEY